ncbi:hypothetical protein LB467_12760 [Salegentibacter sp. JZCK2]|uniref:hypothetical protein n=1 Tax=Salegentibacter tibetensis TaxID=2873600 RepID=UPI001CCC2F07|nr:hypothetical protein [Salegentibacter tibetensis]MBZ9730558.1 hypothetical protein [Salegentibacter tibetensis]
MRNYIIGFLLLTLTNFSFGQEWNEKYGQPIVVLIETDPWLMVIGSDVPTFALYENGQIIYKKVVNKKWKYFEVTNDRETTQKIIKSFGITDTLMKQPDFIEASSSTDQPTNILLLNFDTLREISVYGSLEEKRSEARKKTPEDFITVYDNIKKFKGKGAKDWMPDNIEIMLTDYSHSPEEPQEWPENWPDLESESTVKRSESLYSLFLSKEHFENFINLISKLKEKQAVEINGKKFSVRYRLPFPNLR